MIRLPTLGGVAYRRHEQLLVPGARLVLVPGMGHDMPEELTDRFVDELTAHFTA